jgi:hypothetical protein
LPELPYGVALGVGSGAVCDDEDAEAKVRGADARSRIMDRYDLVSCILQRSNNSLELHTVIERK